jgi:hypothetical protein
VDLARRDPRIEQAAFGPESWGRFCDLVWRSARQAQKIARAAPGSRVFCRILSDCVGAEWPLSRKFGCEPAMAVEVLEHAMKLGLEPHGVSGWVAMGPVRSELYSAATINGFFPLAVRAVGISTTRVSKSSFGVLIIG